MTPTEEQEKIIAMARQGGSLKVNAFAGTGKTTTLGLLADAHPASQVLYLAFNKDIARDAGDKMGTKVASQTMHSAAFRAMKPNRDRLDARMSGGWVADRFSLSEYRIAGKRVTAATQGSMVLQALSRFCNSSALAPTLKHVPGIRSVFDHVPEEMAVDVDAWREISMRVLGAAQRLWEAQADRNSSVPITHDTYLKIWALSEPQIKTDLIMFDEAQDASPVFIDLLAKQEAPVVWVGDKHQQIYAWRGAVDALANVRADHEGFLTQSFRFGDNVSLVANALLDYLGESLPLTGVGGDSESDTKAILCRTNAEAIAQFMAVDGAAELAGARELSYTLEQLEDLMNGRPRGAFSLFNSYAELVEHAESGAGRELKAIVRAVDNYGIEAIRDKVSRSRRRQRGYKTTISTCHKSKGREWGSVEIAGDWPTEGNGKPRLSDEETRLMYVAVTRAQRDLNIEAIRPWLKLVGVSDNEDSQDEKPEAVIEIQTDSLPETPKPEKPKKRASANAERQARFVENQKAMGRKPRKIWATDDEATELRRHLETLRSTNTERGA